MDTQLIYKHAPDCLPEDMDGEILVYSPSLATTLHLNGPSAIVWGLCTGQHSIEDMIEALCEVYPEQAEQVRIDVIDVIRDLAERGFLITEPS